MIKKWWEKYSLIIHGYMVTINLKKASKVAEKEFKNKKKIKKKEIRLKEKEKKKHQQRLIQEVLYLDKLRRNGDIPKIEKPLVCPCCGEYLTSDYFVDYIPVTYHNYKLYNCSSCPFKTGNYYESFYK